VKTKRHNLSTSEANISDLPPSCCCRNRWSSTGNTVLAVASTHSDHAILYYVRKRRRPLSNLTDDHMHADNSNDNVRHTGGTRAGVEQRSHARRQCFR